MDTSTPFSTLRTKTGSLSSWLETTRKLEREREEPVRKLETQDREITITKAEYGAIHNKGTPVLKLPSEVTCLIFVEAFSTFEFNKEDDGHTQVHLTELAISHVCRQWRLVAIGLPILWSSFCYHGSSATSATLNRFEVYLDRSKSNTLEFWFDFRNTTIDLEMHSTVLDQAIAVASRWRLISIFSDGDSTEIATRLKTLHVPNLEHLALYPDPMISLDDTLSLVVQSLEPHIFAKGAPKLISARLSMTTPISCLPPLSTVTTLLFDFRPKYQGYELPLSLDALCAILTLPNLESLSLVSVSIDDSVDEPNDMLKHFPVLMGRLRNLRISNSNNVLDLLPSMRASLLETLVLQNMFIDEEYGVLAKLDESNLYYFPSLTSLSIIDISCDCDDSLWYFAHTTSAAQRITIVVHNDFELDTIIEPLRYMRPTQEPLWPHLETLLCDFDYEDNAEALFRFMMDRGDLILRISDTRVMLWEEALNPDVEYAAVEAMCTVEVVPEEELRDQGPWPPGGDGVLRRRIDLEADPFVSKISHE